jgi:anthranilate synthase component 1
LSSQYHFQVRRTRHPADEITPVRLYRQLRTYFSPSVLLESNNFTQARDTHSIIGVDPLIEVEMRDGLFTETYFPAAQAERQEVEGKAVFAAFESVVSKVSYSENPGDIDGFFGFTSFDAYRFAEPEVANAGEHATLPDLHYFFFRFLLVFDHFHEHIDIVEFIPKEQESMTGRLLRLFKKPLGDAEQFACLGKETSTLSDTAYEALVTKGKAHCDRGDTFQVVLSRGFEQAFEGDDFNVYRQLRRLNPSPYCFYFDFGPYRMLGASPEALLTVKDGRATMRPIAGTYAVTGDKQVDNESADKLLADPKENAEHRMLVDLARNDLSRSCYPVRVDQLRKIERYSHLMHIVSQVSGKVEGEVSPYSIYTQCFPAGTLSGAPKFKAVELIYAYEQAARGAYGGGLGYVSPRGGFDHCIIIRSAVVIGNTLHFRAGAGIVSASDEVSERKEVTHKTNALRRAITLAEEASKIVVV